ncbi:DMT family transporter [Urechidicola vernalis]|uniref:EamA family transporter n=1 Tax=Urechidicola vernalis TaxID=3075600 RepID=A0ABU2Y3A9_9FLAO|nr:EamA family transporter [Urechidicola sp. P050]MDT0552661.1 EamA family transporter [Urechidicola sp. P050]
MQESRLKNYLHLHFIIFIWGFTAILGALISIDAIPLVWYRMLLASFFLILFILLTKKNLKIDNRTLLKFIFGGVVIALHWITFFLAIKSSNVSIALITMSTGAFFASLIEPIFFKRRLSKLELFLGLIVVVGLYIIFQVEGDYLLGIIYGLISSFLSAVFSVANGLYVKKNNPIIISFYQLFFGTLFITLLLFFTNQFSGEFFKVSTNDWIYLIILGSVCTAYAFSSSVKVMKVLSPYTVMLSINLEPIYGIILALIIFGDSEKMSSKFYIGALIILLSVILNGLVKNRKQLLKRIQKK